MLHGTFLQSKIGRQIFGLFICCSIVPVLLLSILSFTQVMKNLEEQGHRRLHQSTKALAMSILERLMLLDGELQNIGTEYVNTCEIKTPRVKRSFGRKNLMPFKSVCLYRDGHPPKPLLGNVTEQPPINDTILNELRTGSLESAIVTQNHGSSGTKVFLIRLLEAPEQGILSGELDTAYLWSVGVEHSLPPMTDLCVISHTNEIVINSLSNASPLLNALRQSRQTAATSDFEWEDHREAYIASHFTLFLESQFVANNWTVVLSQTRSDLLAPLRDFSTIFPGVVTLSLLVVAFLSMYYIRQTMVPLEKIKEGINQVSRRNFDARIAVRCNNEFQDLAGSFNDMALQLGKQFKALNTKSEIDRAILSSLDTERIITTALAGIQGFLACNTISIILMDPKNKQAGTSYAAATDSSHRESSTTVQLTSGELMQLYRHEDSLIIPGSEAVPGYLAPAHQDGLRMVLVLPVLVKNRLGALINMGYRDRDAPPDDDLRHARQFADQMAVALSNSSLIGELDELNWGTLKALARTVDAKSSWTAGHSERVCEIAMRVGHTLGLTQSELAVLHRAALLHDIGKVGIPNKILDKPSRLTTEEFDVIKTHPDQGARILEPISAYKEAIPMVRQHHEKYDGTGYPNRLRGDRIDLGARILTVADVFDAMVANRPYRTGLALDDVLRYIREGAGSHFDPEVVDAFLTVVSTHENVLEIFDEKAFSNREVVKL